MKHVKSRKPIHPGIILEEHYLKSLDLNLQDIADHLGLARNTLFKLRTGKANITPSIALALASAFDTSPQLWLNLQQKYDLWVEEFEKPHLVIDPLYKGGRLISCKPISHRRRRVDSHFKSASNV
jgi:addiction module HigA family antidote